MSGFTTKEEFFSALRENRERAGGRAKAAIAEEIADEAEAFGDDEVAVTALVELMSAYHGSGEQVKYPVAFARLLRLWDRNPKAFDDWEAHRVFWYFKWVSSGLLSTPDVPLTAIRGWIAEMRKRYEAAEHGLQPVYRQLHSLAQHLGEGEELAYELWATRGRTRMSDCEACEARARAEYHFGRGEDERGMAELAATLDGRTSCEEEPQSSQAVALLPLVRLGRTDEARGAHLASYRAVRGREAHLGPVGRHLEFCALTGNEARGLELLSQNRALFGFTASPLERLDFLTRTEVLLRRLAAVGHGDTPCGGPLGREWTVAELLAWVAPEADALAARFDARNGNTARSRWRAALLAGEPLVTELNLGVRSAAFEGSETPLTVPAVGSAAAAVPETVVPDDFAALVAEALLLDKQYHPDARRLWDALLERAAGPDADRVDDVLRGEIATERASRAHQAQDSDAVRKYFAEAAESYTRAGRPDRAIASAARVQWSMATYLDQDTDAAAVADAAWLELNKLLNQIDALLAAGDLAPFLADARVQKLVVHQSRVFVARHAALRAADPADREGWLAVFRAEVDRMVREGADFNAPQRLAVVMEAIAEYDATHDDAQRAEPPARQALQIFTDLAWPWRLHRSRMLLGLALAGQDRHAEAIQVLQTGIAEAHPGVDADELTPLYRLLAETAWHGGEHATAVRAFAEAAVRLDREGDAFGAVETRWRMSQALAAQGQTADAVAVLETLVETPLGGDGGYEAESVAERESDAEQPSSASDNTEPRSPDRTVDHQTDSGADNAEPESPTESVDDQTDSGADNADNAGSRAASESAAATVPVAEQKASATKPTKQPTRAAMLMVQVRADLARGLLALDEPRAAAVEFLHVADAVDGWPDASRLTAAAAEAAGALALARNWEGAKAAWQRAVASNAVAPRIPDMTEALRDMAGETINAFGAERADEALDYLAQADQLRTGFAEESKSQFRSVEVDEAQTCYTRGWVLNAAGRPEEAIAQLERAADLYDRPGFAEIPPRFDAIRQAAVIEYRSLERPDAARVRLDKAISEAEAAGHSDGAATLRKLRDALR